MTSCRIIKMVLNTSQEAMASLLGPQDADLAVACGRRSGVRSVSWRLTNRTIGLVCSGAEGCETEEETRPIESR